VQQHTHLQITYTGVRGLCKSAPLNGAQARNHYSGLHFPHLLAIATLACIHYTGLQLLHWQ